VAQIADIVFGAVKPGIMTKVLSDIASSLNKESLVVSIAAGVTLDQLARALGHDRKIIRAMPNTPSLVNAGMTSVTPNALVSSEDVAEVLTIFRCFGQAENCRADDPSGGGRERFRAGLCLYVYRSDGRCRRSRRNAARSGL
jgi:pyrroline-5-carboxylate reductase